MNTRILSGPRGLVCAAMVAACAGMAVQSVAGTWQKVSANAPGAVNLMLLLSDGTVLCANNNGSTIGKGWFKLTPNATGSYVGGTWTTLASSIDTRLYYTSQVLMDGRVLIAGGEYGTGMAKSEVYDPLTNVWTAIPVPTSLLNPSLNSPTTGLAQSFYDSNSEILPNGKVLVTPVNNKAAKQSMLFDPVSNTWAAGPNLIRGSYQDEASWVKLATTNMILTIDPFGVNSERYNPGSNTWINDSNVPVSLYDPFGFELGGAVLLPNGKAFFLGSTGNTAIYTPSGTVANGVWAAGPVIPGAQGAPDAPCAMMVTGNVLCAVSPVPTSGNHFPSPVAFYEYDYVANTFTSTLAPGNVATDSGPTYTKAMLCLPTGQVLYSHMGADVYVYNPTGSALAAGKPTITSITKNLDGSFHLVGTKINGMSEGASYGDDLQMNSNYPLVRLSSGANQYYCRTYNWSSCGVQTGATAVSTEFKLPGSLPAGNYQLVVIGNGFVSDAALPPSVASNPANAVGCPGGTRTFTASGSGFPTLSYQWRKGVVNLANGGHYSGVTTPTLTVSSMSAADAATNYNCVISSFLGTATTTNAKLSYCAADFNCDGQVDDADFVTFASAYNILDCADPAMPPGCPADLNGDGVVDDADFVIFAGAYDVLICS